MPRGGGRELTWDEASPELRRIVAANQQWAEDNGYAPKGSPEHGALRMMKGEKGESGAVNRKEKFARAA